MQDGIDRKPLVVCFCGSTRFKQEFEEAEKRFTLAGRIVLTVGFFGHHEKEPVLKSVKERLDELHLRKIDIADYVYVINPGGYIGDSTAREIAYAVGLGKAVFYLADER